MDYLYYISLNSIPDFMMSDNCGYDMYEIVNHASKTLLTFIANKDSFVGSKLFI